MKNLILFFLTLLTTTLSMTAVAFQLLSIGWGMGEAEIAGAIVVLPMLWIFAALESAEARWERIRRELCQFRYARPNYYPEANDEELIGHTLGNVLSTTERKTPR